MDRNIDNNIRQLVSLNLKKRNQAEARFRFYGISAIAIILLILSIVLGMILVRGYPAFITTKIGLEIDLSKEVIAQNLEITQDQLQKLNNQEIAQGLNYRQLIKNSLNKLTTDDSGQESSQKLKFYRIFSTTSNIELKHQIINNPDLLGKKAVFYLPASSKVDVYFKQKNQSSLDEDLIILLKKLTIRTDFNWQFFKNADSREAENAGVAAGVVGSFFTSIIFLAFSFPIAVMSAFYLEEFAPKNRLTDIIEVSINNLAAIPSIIYGLLGLAIYLQFMKLPRSSSLVGGLTLFLLVLPIITIATRNTIRSIPDSIRDAAAAIGASKMQIILHHLLPLSIPGIMTGTILSISRAVGETAPLLMIGMVAFIANVPHNFYDPTTVIPVQIYLWANSPETGFVEKTSAAIIILLALLIMFNSLAVLLRKKFEIKW
jgi:phosphate transport system permease protein